MEARTKGVHMSKELLDRIQELLLENASLKEDVASLRAIVNKVERYGQGKTWIEAEREAIELRKAELELAVMEAAVRRNNV